MAAASCAGQGVCPNSHGKDHLEALGSIESIALAKAGIFKPGGQAVMGPALCLSCSSLSMPRRSVLGAHVPGYGAVP
jgi:hypothetical protein